MTSNIKTLLNEKKQQLTVNSINKKINTVNSVPIKPEYLELESKTNELLNELQGEPKYLADKLSRELDDQKSIRWFLLLAKNNKAGVLIEALSQTLSVYKEGGINTTKIKYFIGILRRKGINIKFKK